MAGGGFKYKLVGLLIADIKDCCRRLGDNEKVSAHTLKAFRSSINDLARQYHERIVDPPEDNIMFNSC